MTTNQLKSHRLDYLEKQLRDLSLGYEILMEDYHTLRADYVRLHEYKSQAEKVMEGMGLELDRISNQVFHTTPSKKYESRIVYKGGPAQENATSSSDPDSD
jgi:hypothetical protein